VVDTDGGPDDKTAARGQTDDGRKAAPDATPPTESGAVSEGRVLKNRYLLERKIGAGGMGFVFGHATSKKNELPANKSTTSPASTWR